MALKIFGLLLAFSTLLTPALSDLVSVITSCETTELVEVPSENTAQFDGSCSSAPNEGNYHLVWIDLNHCLANVGGQIAFGKEYVPSDT
jgi:hypothetical protein